MTIRRLDPGAQVLICHDPFAGNASVAEVQAATGAEVVAAPAPARRGYLSLLGPYFAGVEHLAACGVRYEWLVYLSAQDYPTRRGLSSVLEASPYDGYLRHWDALAPANPWRRRRQGVRRYLYQYRDAPAWAMPVLRVLRLANRIQSLVHVHLVYGPRVGTRSAGAPFNGRLTCFAGTQWTVLRRACAELVAERARTEAGLMDWFARTVCPCEAVVQTLLANDGRFRLCDDDLRFADFAGSRDGRPRTLGPADLEAITAGPWFFARKFDPQGDNARVLDLLDDRLGI